jgi:hypothetical protein
MLVGILIVVLPFTCAGVLLNYFYCVDLGKTCDMQTARIDRLLETQTTLRRRLSNREILPYQATGEDK